MARKKNKYRVNLIYLAHLSIKDGLKLVDKALGVNELYYNGERVRREQKRMRVLKSCELKCSICGAVGTHFLIVKHRNDKKMPWSINAYAGDIMLTWDHIIPKSLMGSDDPANARIACEYCNSRRGNEMTLHDLLWVNQQNPHAVYKSHIQAESLKKLIKSAEDFCNN
jgi:5-methylcytosine-specific restriction endonuclease McrA